MSFIRWLAETGPAVWSSPELFNISKISPHRRTSLFSGAETVQLSYTFLDDGSPIAVDPTSVRLQPDDIVLDHGGIVGVELILSGKPLKFGALPDRLDSLVFTKRCSPLVTIVAFTLAGTTFSRPRFPRAPKKVYLDPPDRI